MSRRLHAQTPIVYHQWRFNYTRPGGRGEQGSIVISHTHYFMKLTDPGVKAGNMTTSLDSREWSLVVSQRSDLAGQDHTVCCGCSMVVPVALSNGHSINIGPQARPVHTCQACGAGWHVALTQHAAILNCCQQLLAALCCCCCCNNCCSATALVHNHCLLCLVPDVAVGSFEARQAMDVAVGTLFPVLTNPANPEDGFTVVAVDAIDNPKLDGMFLPFIDKPWIVVEDTVVPL